MDYTDGSINDVIKIEIFYQSSSDTNMQSGMSTESPMAVPIDVRALSSIDKQKHAKLAFSYLFQVTFLSATL